MVSTDVFPPIRARNLEGVDVDLPDGFIGDRNVVAIAFQRNHQSLVEPDHNSSVQALGALAGYTIRAAWVPVSGTHRGRIVRTWWPGVQPESP